MTGLFVATGRHEADRSVGSVASLRRAPHQPKITISSSLHCAVHALGAHELRTTRTAPGPAAAAGPGGPGGPWGPAAPGGPESPFGPGFPFGPSWLHAIKPSKRVGIIDSVRRFIIASEKHFSDNMTGGKGNVREDKSDLSGSSRPKGAHPSAAGAESSVKGVWERAPVDDVINYSTVSSSM